MQLPQSKIKQAYIDQIKIIEVKLKDATLANNNHLLLDKVQKSIDDLAEKYQYREEIGTAIYKLYELQALVKYFGGKDSEALEFINQAIESRGSSYERANNLKSRLTKKTVVTKNIDQNNMTKQERRKKLIGLEGWLAWYVVGLFIGTSITIFNFFKGGIGLSNSEIDNLNQYQAGLGDTFRTLTSFENVALLIYIALLISATVFILRRKKIAKTIAIVSMIFGALYMLADYAIASSIFNSADLTQYVQSELNEASKYASRNVFVALVWIPYFLKSKRVKMTLTK